VEGESFSNRAQAPGEQARKKLHLKRHRSPWGTGHNGEIKTEPAIPAESLVLGKVLGIKLRGEGRIGAVIQNSSGRLPRGPKGEKKRKKSKSSD